MKKTMLALMVMGACTSGAYAESSIVLFGAIEEGLLVQKNSKAAAQVMLGSGYSQTNKWGITGVEDLGNGNSIGFNLEAGFQINNGTVAGKSYTTQDGFTREAWLYASGDWGTLGAGRTYALSFNPALMTGWIQETGTGSPSWATYGNSFNRINNAIGYKTPTWAGLFLNFLYSNGVGSDTQQWSHNTHYYGVMAYYNAHNIKSNLTYENVDWKGEKYLTDGYTTDRGYGDQNAINFGIEYTIGDWTPMFAYQWSNTKNGDRHNMFGLSTKVKAWGGEILGGVRYIFGRDESLDLTKYSTDKYSAYNIVLGYFYPLSKRTMFKALGAWTGSQKAWHERGFTDLTSTASIYQGYQLFIGLRHTW